MSSPNARNIWEKVLDAVRREGKTYTLSWMERLSGQDLVEQTLILGVPDPFFRDWVDDHYKSYILNLLAELGEPVTSLQYQVVEAPVPRAAPVVAPTVKSTPRSHRLNERFIFSNYVVAESNQLPAAAAKAVSENPGRCYNPLFIYGGPGLGKTHLLHAVGNAILQHTPGARILYLTSEEFTNEYVESVRDGRMPEFRRKFRDECDVLLIDDIQTLGRKEETQKEFFYTFNTLHEMSKAIVLTSDTVPAEIPGLEDRLR